MEEFLDALSQQEGPAAYAVLAACAALEYLFPPFPGDTVTLFGAFLITACDWSASAVFATVTGGSLIGASAVYWVGRGLASGPEDDPGSDLSWWRRYWMRSLEKTEPAARRLQAKGPAFLVLNRFFPGIRSFFFLAAGRARLSFPLVLFYAGVSAVLWNAMVIALGAHLGASWPRLLALARLYSVGVWFLVASVGAVVALRWWWSRRR